MMEIQALNARLTGLVIFRGILQDAAVAAFARMLALAASPAQAGGLPLLEAAAQFEAALFETGSCWTAYLESQVLENENGYIRRSAAGRPDETMQAALDAELATLQQLAGVTWPQVLAGANGLTDAQRAALDVLQPWRVEPVDMAAAYARRAAEAGRKGYGAFARYHVFTLDQGGGLVPVRCPDGQRLADLPGYEAEREKVVANTKALLAGLPAGNVLLYGDAGTGKSSTVKAIANEYAGLGLRLVEVKKHQLFMLPELMDRLAADPLKFILFIDDLSFSAGDENFAALKAILEGSVGGRAANVAVYATSNRRHLVKETLADRAGDDIHEADTRQELMSLSARFGLTVTFQRPEKQRYAQIVTQLAQRYGVALPEEQLLQKAEAFAIRSGGRSPRAARQFIELCKGGVPL